jgi:hypothetical protein
LRNLIFVLAICIAVPAHSQDSAPGKTFDQKKIRELLDKRDTLRQVEETQKPATPPDARAADEIAKRSDASDDRAWRAMEEVFSKSSKAISSENCDVLLKIDFDKYQTNMAIFRDAWLYRDKPVEYYQRHATQVLATIARKQATMVTQSIFGRTDGSNPASCQFRFLVKDQDKYGNEKPYQMLSWRFTKSLASKVNWEKLDDKNFPKLAIDYVLSTEWLRRANLESTAHD